MKSMGCQRLAHPCVFHETRTACFAGPFSQSSRGSGAGCGPGSCRCGPDAAPGVCLERHTQVRLHCALPGLETALFAQNVHANLVQQALCCCCITRRTHIHMSAFNNQMVIIWTASSLQHQRTVAMHRCSATGKVLPAVEVLCPSMLPGWGKPVASATSSYQDEASAASALASATRTAGARSAGGGGSSEEAPTPPAAAPAVAKASGISSYDPSGGQMLPVQLGSIGCGSHASLPTQSITDGVDGSQEAVALAGV